jgi:hypothetical protein
MSGAGSVPVNPLKPLADWIDELGLDRVTADLIAGRLNAWWYDLEIGEFQLIRRVHWNDAKEVNQAAGWGWLKRPDGLVKDTFKIFAAQAPMPAAQPVKNAGGRPPKHDWPGVAISLIPYVHHNGFPETQAELERVIEGWFKDNKKGIPAESEIKKFAQRIFREFHSKG